MSAVLPKVGYVMKVYPRFSETFIVSELLALEAAGTDLEVVSLRPPLDGRFHESLAGVRAPVRYLAHSGLRAGDVWAALGRAHAALPGLRDHLDELLDTPVVEAVQALELAAHVQARGIGHLHAHFASVAATVTRLAAAVSGVPYSVTAHAKDIFHESVDPDDLRRKLADAATVVTVSDFNLQHLRAAYGEAAAKVVRLYNGLDLPRFPYDEPAGRPPVIAAVGRLVEKKGFGDLLLAVRQLVDEGRDVRLELVGAGELDEQLRASVASLGLAQVVSMPGPLPQSRVREVVQGAAVFAAPCVVAGDGNRDGLPTVLLEAMALGTPCVATPVTGIPEVVVDGETGLLVPEHAPDRLARALAALLDDAALRVRLAGQARVLVEERFDSRRQAAALRQVFAGSGRG